MDKTLGAYVIEAARAALDDAGITPDEVDGIVTSAGGQTNHVSLGSQWGPHPALLRRAVRHARTRLTYVTAEWLRKTMNLPNVKYMNSHGATLWNLIGARRPGRGRRALRGLPGPLPEREHRGPLPPEPDPRRARAEPVDPPIRLGAVRPGLRLRAVRPQVRDEPRTGWRRSSSRSMPTACSGRIATTPSTSPSRSPRRTTSTGAGSHRTSASSTATGPCRPVPPTSSLPPSARRI